LKNNIQLRNALKRSTKMIGIKRSD